MARFFLFLLTVFNSLCICANVTADDKLAMNIGGNLNVESKQDTDYAKGNNWGVNAGVGHGYGTNAKGQDMSGNRSGNAGFNVGSSNHDSAWVNDVTELRGGDVDINVGGKTTVTGAVIAAGEDGNLNLATNELEYKDLHDFNTSNERGFGVSTSVGGAITDQGEFNLHPQGSTTVSATHTGSDTEQTTHATIGVGNITVGGDTNPELAGLNRDTDKVQEITKDEITGSLDSSVTVDNRIFSESGRKEISDQHEHFVDNAIVAGVGAYGTIAGTAEQVYDVATGDKSVSDGIKSWQADQSGMATGIRRGGSDEAQQIIKAMSDGFVSPEDLQKLAGMTADGSVNIVYSNDQENVVFFDKDGNVLGAIARDGFNDLTNNQGYVNLANGAGTDAYTFLRTDAEERAHNYVGANEDLAKAAANNEMSYYNTVADWTGGYSVAPRQYGAGLGTNAQSQYNQQYSQYTNTLLLENSSKALQVDGNTADGIVRLIPSTYYTLTDGNGYKAATEKVATELPLINKLDENVSNILSLPVQVLDSLTSNGMFSNILGTAGKGITYVAGEDTATFTFDVLEGVAIGGALKGLKSSPTYSPGNTKPFWDSVTNKSSGSAGNKTNIPGTATESGIKSTPDFIVDSSGRAMPGTALNNAPKGTANFIAPTNLPSYPTIPEGSIKTISPNGATIFKTPDGGTIRIMPPSKQYPNGYWRQTNKYNQPINPSTGKPGKGPADTHIPLP